MENKNEIIARLAGIAPVSELMSEYISISASDLRALLGLSYDYGVIEGKLKLREELDSFIDHTRKNLENERTLGPSIGTWKDS